MLPRDAVTAVLLLCLGAGCSVSEPEADRLVPLPFLVSDEFTASGFMGDGSAQDVIVMAVDSAACHERLPDARGACYRFDYRPPAIGGMGWGGVYWQAPPNNWGSLPGKQIAAGATQLRLKAAGARGGELATFRVGGLSGSDASGEPYPHADSFQAEQSFPLTAELTDYVVPIPADAGYDRVLGGFAWTLLAPADRSAQTLYLDDVRWE